MADQNRTSLTFEEKITVAWAYHVRGISQQDLAGIFNINSGRISEACKSVETALKDYPKTSVSSLDERLRGLSAKIQE
jgi:DNA-binding transcriptional regulator LsrR (DeoR family)